MKMTLGQSIGSKKTCAKWLGMKKTWIIWIKFILKWEVIVGFVVDNFLMNTFRSRSLWFSILRMWDRLAGTTLSARTTRLCSIRVTPPWRVCTKAAISHTPFHPPSTTRRTCSSHNLLNICMDIRSLDFRLSSKPSTSTSSARR